MRHDDGVQLVGITRPVRFQNREHAVAELDYMLRDVERRAEEYNLKLLWQTMEIRQDLIEIDDRALTSAVEVSPYQYSELKVTMLALEAENE